MSDKQHAKFAPSASHRWIACPGSIALCEKVPPPKETIYAKEGTAAHCVGELSLKKSCNAEAFLGQVVYAPGDERYVADQEMVDHVQVYVDAVKREIPMSDPGEKTTYIETKFDLSWVYPEMFGSNDCCIYDKHHKKLLVFDLKYGKGVVVEPEWNTQLLMYALGAAHTVCGGSMTNFIASINTVELIIVQPRAYHHEGPVRRWSISSKDLLDWALKLLRPAAQATEKEDAPLRAGKHCRFCPALAVCPEQVKNACEIAKTEFSKIETPKPVLPAPESLTPEEIVKVMHVSDTFSAWAKEVVAYAQSQLEAGVKLPGYKLVKKRSNRKWINEVEAEDKLKGVLGEYAYDKKVLSVAKAEKLLKKSGVSPDLTLEGLWEKPESGVVIAPESDKRAAIESTGGLEFLDFLE